MQCQPVHARGQSLVFTNDFECYIFLTHMYHNNSNLIFNICIFYLITLDIKNIFWECILVKKSIDIKKPHHLDLYI